MDRWKRKELKCMELGGNKNAREYFDANGMFKDGKPDHCASFTMEDGPRIAS